MLLIIQNGYINPSITRYLNEQYEIIKSYEINVSELDINKYSLVIILGGYQSVTRINEYPYLLNITKLIDNCINLRKPLLGICLGCQLIAYTLGCNIVSSGKLNIGYDVKLLDYQNIFRSHIDYIIPNDKITVIEYFENMPYLYRYQDYVWGIQCHADITPENVQSSTNHLESIEYSKKNYKKINKDNAEIIAILLNNIKKLNN
jgi:GMP synthase-like glutamine amidotransferase